MNKYQLGQLIKHQNDPLADVGRIVHVSIDNARVLYTIALKEWDAERREVVEAVKHIFEEEALLVEEVLAHPAAEDAANDGPVVPQETTPAAPVQPLATPAPTHAIDVSEPLTPNTEPETPSTEGNNEQNNT